MLNVKQSNIYALKTLTKMFLFFFIFVLLMFGFCFLFAFGRNKVLIVVDWEVNGFEKMLSLIEYRIANY